MDRVIRPLRTLFKQLQATADMPRLTQQDALQLLAFEVMRARARHQNAAIIEQMQRCAIERRVMFKTGIVILATLDQGRWVRSEEHTSELQSLMRISYAVFCLKKKKDNTQHAD